MCDCQIFYSMGILEDIIGRLEREEELSAEKKKHGKAWIAVPVALSLSAVLGGAFAAIPVFICGLRSSVDTKTLYLEFFLDSPNAVYTIEPKTLYFSKWSLIFYFSWLRWNEVIRTEWGTFHVMLLEQKQWKNVKQSMPKGNYSQ